MPGANGRCSTSMARIVTQRPRRLGAMPTGLVGVRKEPTVRPERASIPTIRSLPGIVTQSVSPSATIVHAPRPIRGTGPVRRPVSPSIRVGRARSPLMTQTSPPATAMLRGCRPMPR
jgi:hypothetical protein